MRLLLVSGRVTVLMDDKIAASCQLRDPEMFWCVVLGAVGFPKIPLGESIRYIPAWMSRWKLGSMVSKWVISPTYK